MDVVHLLEGLLFEWDADKEASNIERHGVSFGEAAQVFLDPLRVYLDDDEVDGEIRETVVGWSFQLRALLVVHTERGSATRIISARVPTAHERRNYADQGS